MSKFKFVGEYEIRASKKMLYPYLSTASGLAQWFADDVNIDEDKTFTIIWDGEENKAKMVSHRTNSQVKFEFVSDDEEPSYVEFKVDMNEMTQSVFIRVTDYSDMDDENELQDLWESLMTNLREIVGG
ncbi:START-like domain-containing protein [Reichenbachiella carrageenanivorans]|uniref:START-like domain-containing protein n=1 Tax=Reichenbachiella carrageenanivorans TaxID=2979869 RepID=A0ABY6D2F4_9BACT|nr:START-like domain-containing protein [Reichenbachiella carrageenanivorans]UXX78020.1 START-like domain-containing protein [Reichenbachiella carrageenanivorans]